MNPIYDTFRQMLEQVAGQAFAAAGFALQKNPLHHMRGLFRYRKAQTDGWAIYIEWQALAYESGGPSRFRVILLRSKGADARSASHSASDPAQVEIALSRLIWDSFDIRQYDTPDHWWLFRNPTEMAYAIAEAGKLVFGFGVPWLEGKLQPGKSTD